MGRPPDRNRLHDDLIEQLRRDAARPLGIRDILRELRLPRERKRELQALLRRLCDEGELVATRGRRFGVAAEMSLASGTLSAHPDGYGWISLEGGRGRDVYVGSRRLGGALHGDRVLVRIERTEEGRAPEGSVVRVLRRARSTVVGRLDRSGAHGYLTPSDRRLGQDVFIPAGRLGDAEDGHVVVAEVTAWPDGRRPAEGAVLEVLGKAGDPGVAEEVIVRRFELPDRFPRRVLEEAAAVPAQVRPGDLAGRIDLRELLTATIDGETARDFDDAISVELTGRGTWLTRVHVADVGHYVAEGSQLDREAYARGTSVYFPGRVLPMLPERLSNGICSLNPGVDRLAFTVLMEVSRQGKVLRSDFLETAIRSDARLTYPQVARALDGGDAGVLPEVPGLAEMLGHARDLAAALRSQRVGRGSIDFDLPEEEILLDLRGSVQDVVRRERNVATRLIEELMIAANEAVAGWFTSLKVPGLYRVHEPPDPEKLAAFAEFAAGFGHKIRLPREPSAKLLADFVAVVVDRPEGRVLNEVLLRSMKQAVYAMENIGHFGLASRTYTHFTSPIRRYPDLVTHRLLRELVRRGRFTPQREDELLERLPEVAAHSSARERVAVEAEREVIDLRKAEYLAGRVGETKPGFITAVTHFGFFVELADVPVEGLVHVSTLGDDYYRHHEDLHALVGTNTGATFRLGDAVTVRIAAVDTEQRRIDFVLARERGEGEAAGARPEAKGRRRGGPVRRGAGRAAGRPGGPRKGGGGRGRRKR